MLRSKNIEDKIPDITNIATNTTLNAKINEVKGEIPSNTQLAATTALNAKIHKVKNITNLTTTTPLTAIENKIPNISNLVKKTDYNTKILIMIMINILLLKKLTTETFTAKLNQADLANKNDIPNFVKKTDFDNTLKMLL